MLTAPDCPLYASLLDRHGGNPVLAPGEGEMRCQPIWCHNPGVVGCLWSEGVASERNQSWQ